MNRPLNHLNQTYGSVKVLECTTDAPNRRHKRYKVERTCCGKIEKRVTHKHLNDMRRDPPSQCSDCRYRRDK